MVEENNKQLHVVLGADGAAGRAVVEALRAKKLPVRLVGRTSRPSDSEWRSADLLIAEQAKKVITGASHVYLCVGLPYSALVWSEQWPVLMQNVIDACSATGAALVFLDNIYMYGPAPLPVPFDETTSQQPPSKKGAARKVTADLLLAAMKSGVVKGVIGRSADFYGPGAKNSMLYTSFLERMLVGKAPFSLGPTNLPHTYAYTLDNGRALVELSLDTSTYGEVWHLPIGEQITTEEVTDIFNSSLQTKLRPYQLPTFARKIVGIFMPIVREIDEMMYEYSKAYVMSDANFRAHFPDFVVTAYDEGLAVMVGSFRK